MRVEDRRTLQGASPSGSPPPLRRPHREDRTLSGIGLILLSRQQPPIMSLSKRWGVPAAGAHVPREPNNKTNKKLVSGVNPNEK
jgi:hypothetical protein